MGRTKDSIQYDLREVDTQMRTILAKGDNLTPAEEKKADELIEKYETLNTELRRFNIGGAVHEMRQPVESPAGQGIPGGGSGYSLKDEEKRYKAYGEWLQAAVRASMEPGHNIGGKPTGVIDRDLLYPAETRSTGLEEATPSLGGFLINTDFATEIHQKMYDTGSLYSRCRRIPIGANSNGLKLPAVDESSRANGSRLGGVQGYWLGEGGSKTASKPKFRQMELSLKKVIGLLYCTDEILQDSVALGSWAITAFTEELLFKAEDSFINGTGAGQPLGILTSGALVSIAKETGQTAATIVWENLKKLYGQFWARSRRNMIALGNQDILPELMGMSQPIGTGGSPVWQVAGGAAGTPYDTLMGRPLIFHEACPTVGMVGDLMLIDPTEYLVIEKPMQNATSIHVNFTNDETVIRVVWRLDGQPLWNSGLTPFKGSLEKSPFCAIASRT